MFFFKQKTAYEMRISDLSSDVCSSDLHIIDIVRRFPMADVAPQGFVSALRPLQPRLYSLASSLAAAPDEAHLTLAPVRYDLHGDARCGELGRASCRERVCTYVSISVVDGSLKNKKEKVRYQ